MKFKANTPYVAPMGPRAETEMKYKRCRANLLGVILFTVINLFSLSLSQSYFLFSARIPSFFVELFMFTEDGEIAPFTDLIVPIIIGVILTIPYLLCFFFSKKRPGWMVAALVFFVLDCLFLLIMYYLSDVIVDILFHGLVMFYLITGVSNGFKLKKMPEDEPLPAFGETVESETAEDEATETAEGETASPAFDESLFTITEEKTEVAEDNNTSSEE